MNSKLSHQLYQTHFCLSEYKAAAKGAMSGITIPRMSIGAGNAVDTRSALESAGFAGSFQRMAECV